MLGTRPTNETKIIRRLGIEYDEVGITLVHNERESCVLATLGTRTRIPVSDAQAVAILDALRDAITETDVKEQI